MERRGWGLWVEGEERGEGAKIRRWANERKMAGAVAVPEPLLLLAQKSTVHPQKGPVKAGFNSVIGVGGG